MFRFWLTGPLFEEAGDGTGGGGGGSGTGDKSGAAAFDAAAFKTELMGDITKMVQGALKAQKTDFAKLIQGSQQKQGDGQGGGTGDGSGDGTGSGGAGDGQGDGKGKPDPAVTAQIRALERKNRELSDQFTAMKTESDTTKAEADKKDLNSQVRSKLSTKFKFADDAALEDAFEIFSPKVKRDEGGAVVGHDGTPLDQYLEEQMRSRAYLLAPKDVSGAGARGGSKAGKRTFTLDDIDNIKNLSAEDQVKLRSEIASQMAAAQSGR